MKRLIKRLKRPRWIALTVVTICFFLLTSWFNQNHHFTFTARDDDTPTFGDWLTGWFGDWSAPGVLAVNVKEGPGPIDGRYYPYEFSESNYFWYLKRLDPDMQILFKGRIGDYFPKSSKREAYLIYLPNSNRLFFTPFVDEDKRYKLEVRTSDRKLPYADKPHYRSKIWSWSVRDKPLKWHFSTYGRNNVLADHSFEIPHEDLESCKVILERRNSWVATFAYNRETKKWGYTESPKKSSIFLKEYTSTPDPFREAGK